MLDDHTKTKTESSPSKRSTPRTTPVWGESLDEESNQLKIPRRAHQGDLHQHFVLLLTALAVSPSQHIQQSQCGHWPCSIACLLYYHCRKRYGSIHAASPPRGAGGCERSSIIRVQPSTLSRSPASPSIQCRWYGMVHSYTASTYQNRQSQQKRLKA